MAKVDQRSVNSEYLFQWGKMNLQWPNIIELQPTSLQDTPRLWYLFTLSKLTINNSRTWRRTSLLRSQFYSARPWDGRAEGEGLIDLTALLFCNNILELPAENARGKLGHGDATLPSLSWAQKSLYLTKTCNVIRDDSGCWTKNRNGVTPWLP